MNKDLFLIDIIQNVYKKNQKIKFTEIAVLLNNANFKTDRGDSYSEAGIGIGKVINSLHSRVSIKGDLKLAEIIAKTVVNMNGKPAWE